MITVLVHKIIRKMGGGCERKPFVKSRIELLMKLEGKKT